MKFIYIIFFIISVQLNAQWSSLIGNDLSNWETVQGRAIFELNDGIISSASVLNSPNTFLITKEIFSDFILEFEVFVEPGLNSGVQFRSQIKAGVPITLTHKEITRYFMSLKEAAQLVIQAGALSEGGDVLILDMGEPIKIYDLAEKMIELSGLSVKNAFNLTGDIEIKVTGLRPGEKLYEELLLSKNPSKTIHPKIYKSKEPFIKLSDLKPIV